MKLKLLLLVLMVGTFFTCDKDSGYDYDCIPDTITTSIIEKSDIDIRFDTSRQRNLYVFQPGEKLIFYYNYNYAECLNINDDERGFAFAFLIDPGTTEFDFQNEEIKDLKAFYNEHGAWVNATFHQAVSRGFIRGEQISDTDWQVEVNITADSLSTPDGFAFPDQREEVNLEFIEIFTLTESE